MSLQQIPPLRYFFGCVLMAAVSVYLEKSSHITSGGVSGLSIGIADLLHLNVGIINLCIKATIFCFIFAFGGKSIALWTMIGAGITGFSMWLFEMLPIGLNWPLWLTFALILLFAKFPIGLLVSKGYSTGGYTAIALIVLQHTRIPIWFTLLFFNTISIFMMYFAHGSMSATLSTIIALSAGMATEIWASISRKLLDNHTSLLHSQQQT